MATLGCNNYLHIGDRDAEDFTGPCDIPIRDPFDIYESWMSGPLSRKIDKLTEYLTIAITWPEARYHKIEGLPVWIGMRNEHFPRKNLRPQFLVDWINDNMNFYEPFYGREICTI